MATCPDSPYVTMTFSHLCFPFVLAGSCYAQSSTQFVTLLFTYPTGRYFCLVRLRLVRLFVLVSLRLVYILGWRWDDPHLQSTLQPP